jgi:hypothetical protein
MSQLWQRHLRTATKVQTSLVLLLGYEDEGTTCLLQHLLGARYGSFLLPQSQIYPFSPHYASCFRR